MSDLMAAYQPAENGDMIKRLTAPAESQNSIIKKPVRII